MVVNVVGRQVVISAIIVVMIVQFVLVLFVADTPSPSTITCVGSNTLTITLTVVSTFHTWWCSGAEGSGFLSPNPTHLLTIVMHQGRVGGRGKRWRSEQSKTHYEKNISYSSPSHWLPSVISWLPAVVYSVFLCLFTSWTCYLVPTGVRGQQEANSSSAVLPWSRRMLKWRLMQLLLVNRSGRYRMWWPWAHLIVDSLQLLLFTIPPFEKG